MEFIDPLIEKYAIDHTEEETELLKKISRHTYAKVLMPRMLSGHLQGRLLAMLSKMIKPGCILEIGTYTGYSALCLAEGLTDKGKLITIDINEELEKTVRGFFEESSFNRQIDYQVGKASELIPKIKEMFDLVFIDADKENYSLYLEMVYEKIKPGGYIIADNVLWSGKVLSTSKLDKDTKAIINFNHQVHNDNRFENILLPIRDGLLIARKKA